ncbi:MAG: hypothetical protein AB7E55_01305 [Pigmentiphaga sp.]
MLTAAQRVEVWNMAGDKFGIEDDRTRAQLVNKVEVRAFEGMGRPGWELDTDWEHTMARVLEEEIPGSCPVDASEPRYSLNEIRQAVLDAGVLLEMARIQRRERRKKRHLALVGS